VEVREAAVTVEEHGGERSLVAFVQAAPRSQIDEPQLHAYLRAALPEFMVPSRIAVLERLPSHASGKLDRTALPQLAPAPRAERGEGPQGPTESALAAALRELLRLEEIRRDDDIFALGAHSLLAMRIVARIAYTFGVELPLRELFDNPTVAQLARKIDSAPRPAGASPIARADRRAAPTLAALAQRLSKRP
jgi:acyl carrier protein